MSEPNRLTAEELAERLSWLQINTHPATAWKTFEEIKGHTAALEGELAECKAAESLLMDKLDAKDAELARIGAITMGLIPEPEPTEGVEAKVWEMVKAHNEDLAQAVEDRKDAERELAKRDEEIAWLRHKNFNLKTQVTKLTTQQKSLKETTFGLYSKTIGVLKAIDVVFDGPLDTSLTPSQQMVVVAERHGKLFRARDAAREAVKKAKL